MSRDNVIWLIVFIVGASALAGRAMLTNDGMAKEYVNVIEREFVEVPDADAKDADATKWVDVTSDDAPADLEVAALTDDDVIRWTEYKSKSRADYLEQEANGGGTIMLSFWRSFGVWVAALLTLFVLSFLIKDNPLYKISESIFIGVSAAYWMVVAFWTTLMPNMVAKLAPDFVRGWSMPGLGEFEATEYWYIIPLILGVMLVWRLSPVGGWISRWPMAFFIGTFCGLRLITFLHADFLSQIRNSIVSLVEKVPQLAEDGTALLDAAGQPMLGFDLWASVWNIILVIGVLACLVYFFFSFEHKGVVGGTARVGIWFLMITFGAAFGYTVMGRIALLAIRLEFLFDDWLWLVDPTSKRVVETVAMVILMPLGLM